MKQLISDQKVAMSRVNDAVRRILTLKFELGLFEHPYPDTSKLKMIGQPKHKETALDAAAEGMVLLKNQNNTLPLTQPNKLVLVGNAANSKRLLTAAWTFEWLGATEDKQPGGMKTIYEALVEKMPKTQIIHIDSAAYKHQRLFKTMSRQANAIVVAIGEKPYSEFKGNAQTLEISPQQQELVKLAHQTGKPVVLLLLQGRPQVINKIEPYAQAIVYAGWPGEKGGPAIAEMLTGRNTWGKLAFSYPKAVGHFAPYYHKPSEQYFQNYDGQSEYQYPFGHGLSYTTFAYHDLTLSDTIITDPNKPIVATVQVTNTGQVEGSEVALWYLTDLVGTITRPVKQLIGFEKAYIKPQKTYSFVKKIIPSEHFSYPNAKGEKIIEKGRFIVRIGDQEATLYYK